MNGPARVGVMGALIWFWGVAAASAAPLSGRVLHQDGKPVAGATISCFSVRSRGQVSLDETRGFEPDPVVQTRTDASGAFSFPDGKRPSEVVLRASAPGSPTVEITLFADREDPDEPIEIVVPSTVRRTGRATDDAGKGIGGARVRFAGDAGSGDEGGAMAEGKTDPQGRFVITAAPDLEYYGIEVRAAGYALSSTTAAGTGSSTVVLKRGGTIEGVVLDSSGQPAPGAVLRVGRLAVESDSLGRYRLEDVPSGPTRLRALKGELVASEVVRVKKGEIARVELRLGPSSAVEGTVTDERSRRPIAGARVSVLARGARLEDAAEAEEVRSDSRGRFRVAGLSARKYSVWVERPGYLSAQATGAAAARPVPVSVALRRSGGIAGRVVDDKNAPVAGVRVQTKFTGGIRAAMAAGFLSARGSFTRADGTFRLRGLAPGQISVVATREGYVAAARDGIAVRAAEVSRGTTLVLRRGLDVKGRVDTQTGAPIAGAEIRILPPKEPSSNFMWSGGDETPQKPSAVTDGSGRFTARGLAAGLHSARVSANGFATRSFEALEAGGKASGAWPVFVLAPSAAIEGVVRGTGGEPIADAEVWAYGGTESIETSARSDAGGGFRCDGWPGGAAVELMVQAPGYAMRRLNVAAPASGVTIVLTTAATLRGRVEDAETRKPIEVFSISWRTPRGTSFAYRPAGSPFESAEGVFELPDVAPGPVILEASAEGYVEADLAGLEVKEAEVREGLVFSLKKGLAISGRVVDSRGDGVSNAAVGWERETGQRSGMRVTQGAHGTTTDPEGSFRFEGLPAEKLAFVATHPDYVESRKTVDTTSEENVQLALSTGGSIAGVVADEGGRVIPGAAVSLEQSGSTGWSADEARTDGQGRFSFDHLAESRYRLTARSAAGQSEPQETVLGRDQETTGLTLTIGGGTLIVGRVTGLSADRLRGLSVSAWTDSFSADTLTDDAGAFRVPGAPAGELSFWVSTSATMSGRVVEKTVEVPEGAEEYPVEIAFEGEAKLSGRVLRGEQGMPDLLYQIRPDSGSTGTASFSGLTESDGRYAAEGLPDGDYRVSVRGPGASAVRSVTVAGDTTFDVVLGNATLSGFVKDDETGEPLAGATVQAESGQEDRASGIRDARSDSRGFYEIRGLEEGAYQVTGSQPGYAGKTLPLEVSEEPKSLDIALRRGEGAPVHAFDGLTARPLGGINVLAFSASGATAFRGTVTLDPTGRGEIPSLAVGRYAVYVFAQNYAPQFVTVGVPAARLELPLTPGGRVEVRSDAATSGRIFEASGALYLRFPWGRLDGVTEAAAPLAVWDNFTPGAYRFVVGETSFPFTVEEGKTTVLELR